MASRKTYFGIGWPKDPTDPEPGAPTKSDPEDRSAPTVVDDEKVAEGLRQLRSWYQSDAPTDKDQALAATPPPPSAPTDRLGARPTAVGHATGPPPAAQQRPIAPDPMRATMYGHDVHKFDFEAAARAAAQESPPPPAASTALVVANPAVRPAGAFHQQAEAVPDPTGRSPSDSFQLARYGRGEAERLQRPAAGVRRSPSSNEPRPAQRVPIASRIVFGLGIAALLAAIGIWLQSGSGSESAATTPSIGAAAPMPTASSSPAAPAGRPPTPAAVPRSAAAVPERSTAIAPARSPAPAAPVRPAAAAVPLVGEPKAAEHPAPMVLKTARRHREPKPEAPTLPTEVDEAGPAPTSPVAADKEAAEPKARAGDKDVVESKPLIEPKPPLEAREAKDQKDQKEQKRPAEQKGPTEQKGPKEQKARSGDIDATLPPSLN